MVKFTSISLSIERTHAKAWDFMVPTPQQRNYGVSHHGPGSWMLGRTAEEIDSIKEEAERNDLEPEVIAATRPVSNFAPISNYNAAPPEEGYRLKQTHLVHEDSQALLLLVWEST